MSLDSFYVEVSEYQILKPISKGASGQVFEVKNTKTKQHYACKQLTCLSSYKDEQNFVRELEILASFHSKLIIGFHGFSFHSSPNDFQFAPSIYLELAVNGSVLSQLARAFAKKPNTSWTPTKRMICLYGTAYAMKILHDNNITHRDLKPGNVLLDENYYPKLTDFGCSKIQDINILQSTTGIGTPPYMAPELLDCYDFTNSIDVYAFAIMFYEIFTLQPAYPKARLPSNIFNDVRKDKRPIIPDDVSPKIKKFLEICWSSNPSERLTFNQIVDFLKDKDAFIPGTNEDEYQNYIDLINKEVVNMKDPLTGAQQSFPPNIPKTHPPTQIFTPPSPISLTVSSQDICDFPLIEPLSSSGKFIPDFSNIAQLRSSRSQTVYSPKFKIEYKNILANFLSSKLEPQSSSIDFRIFMYGKKNLRDEIREILTFGLQANLEHISNPNFETIKILSTCISLTWPRTIGSITVKDIAAFAKKEKLNFDLGILCFTADDDSVFGDFHQNIIDFFKKTHVGTFLFNATNPKFKEDLRTALKSHNPISINEMRMYPNGQKSTAIIIEYDKDYGKNVKNIQDFLTYVSKYIV